ncbi:SDR family NAD(P)-dependent oxidoreductase [Rhodoferax sp. WC2427]|uniref:type I polyketide synthase n=1 Tax=Rhodoferax sp. WC2427 TaxID=3234144 RepID=UPI003467ABE3
MNNTPPLQEPIAIVGMACRFPGEAENIEAYWEVLRSGGITVGEVPATRWDWRRHFSENPDAPGRAYVKHGNFIRQDLRAFDAGFFGISNREAEVMDPQQRLLLEVAWETIEHAGSDLAALGAARTGVYIGAFTLDNLIGRMGGASRFATGSHTAVGSTATILSNRISHAFNLTGPSLSVDTACSSSLVAVHLAAQAIWSGECDVALAGGVNVMFRPEYVIAMSKGHFLATDGRSKTFDASANGYGRGEGAGVVMLKPLSRAQADGDRILAVLRSTGCNQDGRTEGITVPNKVAQSKLMQQVLDRAGLVPDDVHYVEAHGTGTPLGDPIESAAISSVFGVHRAYPMPVGSVKANIGHLEAASGVASLIKLVLCMRERQLPAVAGLTHLNPAIDFEGLNIRPPRELEALPQGTLRMAVNSFGYGGTNAHAILESPPEAAASTPVAASADGWCMLPISARSDEALADLVTQWSNTLDTMGPDVPRSLLATAALRRTHHDCRVAFAADSGPSLRSAVASWLEARPRAERPLKNTDAVFVFTGMGPQWWGMARELLSSDAASQQLAQKFDGIFKSLSGWSLVDALLQPEEASLVAKTHIAQPANFLCQWLVTQWLAARGVRPAAVVGHSVGEVGSAWASGVLSLEDAIRVSYQRAKLQATTAGQGGMLAVGLSEADALALIESTQGKVEIAAINGPTAVTLAGDEASLSDLAGRLEVRSIFNRRLKVEVAYHSRYMDPILDDLRTELSGLTLHTATTPVWSTVSAHQGSDGLFGAGYWCRNVREPVRFRAAIEDLLDHGYRLFVEIGPHPVIGGNIREIMARRSDEGRTISTLVRGASDFVQLHATLGRLYAAGVAPDWQHLNGPASAQWDLPRHPWLRDNLWAEADSCARERACPPVGPLCGEPLDHPTPTWERAMNTLYLPWIADHKVDGMVLLPGAAYIDTAFAVAEQMLEGDGALCVENVEVSRPLVLEGDATLLYRTSYNPQRSLVEMASREESGGPWTRHAQARISRVAFDDSLRAPAFEGGESLDVASAYARFAQMGLVYGPACQRIQTLAVSGDTVRAELSALDNAPADVNHHLHPTVLDGAFQSLLAVVLTGGDTPWVPTAIDEITLRAPVTGPVVCIGRVKSRSEREIVGELWLSDAAGQLLVHVDGVHCVPAKRAHDPMQGLLYTENFESVLPVGEPMRLGAWMVLSEDGCAAGSFGEALTRSLVQANVARLLAFAVGTAPGPMAISRMDGELELKTLFAEYPIHTLAGVLYLAAGIDSAPAQARARVARVHALVKALGGDDAVPRVYLATCNAQSVQANDSVAGYAQAAVHGYGRVAHNEFTALAVTLLDHDGHPASATALVGELLADDVEDDVALRAGTRWARRVRPLSAPEMRQAALADMVAEPQAVVLEKQAGADTHWRAIAVPTPVQTADGGQTALALHGLVQETPEGADGAALCGFTAQVTQANSRWKVGQWLVGAAVIRPASHIAIADGALFAMPIDGPLVGAERVLTLWAGIHDALRRVVPLAETQSLLLFGGNSEHGRIVRALAPLLGIAHVIDADHYAPQSRGMAARLDGANGSIPLVVFADMAHLSPQKLQLHPGAQLVCMGSALGMEVGPWLGSAATIGVHRVDALATVQRAPQRLAASLLALADAIRHKTLKLPDSQWLSARQWVAQGTPLGQAVSLQSLPPAVAANAGHFDPTGAWLITGGFGGFGLACAEWLAAQGANELILVGRSGANAEAAERLTVLERTGVVVRRVQADIGDAAAVQALCATLAREKLPLAGVLHAAGTLADMTIQEMDVADLQRVMVPKMDGAWHLSDALDSNALRPRHFIMFSSIAATVGNARQANYAAANVAIDALAAARRARGLPADCVAWGALSFGMGVSNETLTRHFEGMGMQPLSSAVALSGLERVLAERPGSVVLAAVDWEQWGRFEPTGGRSPRFAHLTGKDATGGESALKAELAAMSVPEREEMAMLMLTEALSGPLKMAAERIDPERSLSDLGVDSLMAVEVQIAISSVFAVEFSTLELMRGNTVSLLASRVLERMQIAQPTA